mmetsp:Transcript_59397/g.141674  ORF Transcript_59397/g.141674 Transcript_59397/m.141674 type:complete len:645 (+) Transcript_59397:47-1981(+)
MGSTGRQCSNPKCSRREAVEEAALACRCGDSFCTEACWIQGWHAGHQSRCPCAAEIISEAAEHRSQRRGAALLASLALTRWNEKHAEAKAPRLHRNESSRSRFARSQSSKASSWVSLAEAEADSLPDPEKGECPWGCSADDFERLAELGAGSCGTVTKVSHKFTGEVFALKTIQRQLVQDNKLQEHVAREVATQQKLKHPNIVRLCEYFEDSDQIYLLLEFAPEGSLFSKIRAQNCIAHAEAASIFVDVTSALIHLHRHGIAHRDLKPENVLLFPDRAKLADFGWCAELTRDGRKTFCGTMDYLSPEMVSRQPHDHRVDIWALGVLLYEMLVGQPPFQGRNNAHALQRILSVDLVMPTALPEGAAALIQALMQATPEDRPSLEAALRWPWLQDTTSDDEMAIPVEAAECSEETFPVQVPAMHLQPKCVSQRCQTSEASGQRASSLTRSCPAQVTPAQTLQANAKRKSSKQNSSAFGGALRPYHADWVLPAHEEKNASQKQEGAFLLSSCLKPASGLQLRCDEDPPATGNAVAWVDTELYSSIRSWVRQEQEQAIGKESDAGSRAQAWGQARTRPQNSSVDMSQPFSQRLSGSSMSSAWDCGDADASTDVEGDWRSLPPSGSIHAAGCAAASATKAKAFAPGPAG